jgi:major membrane immunogen (membrane-anchored lipoprotein)
MKKISFVALAFSLLISCSRSDDNSSSISTTAVTNTVVSGTWRITYYWDTDHEETSNYNSYNFTFANGGAITAVKTGSTVTGTWSTTLDDSKTKLVLSFSAPASFVELSDDWHVIERTDTKIRLQDVSGGNGGTDYLTFEKN